MHARLVVLGALSALPAFALLACSSQPLQGDQREEQAASAPIEPGLGPDDELAPPTDAEAALAEEPEAPLDVVASLELRNGVPVAQAVDPARAQKLSAVALAPKPSMSRPQLSAPPKLNESLLRRSDPEVRVLIAYRSDLRVPRLPRAADAADPVAQRERALRADTLIRWVKGKRSAGQQRHVAALTQVGARVHERFWLTDTILATVPRSALAALAADPDVLSIEPDQGDLHAIGQISIGRAMLNSDPYYNTPGLAAGNIGMIDTGFDYTHEIFASSYRYARDCYVGDLSNCGRTSSGLVLQPNDYANHGTAVASILSGNNSWGPANHGVTGISFDSFKVCKTATDCSNAGFARGVQAATAVGDDVINISLEGDNYQLVLSANTASDNGAVVLVGAGNSNTTPLALCSAFRVLCVGAVDSTKTRATFSDHGPLSDGRVKPELMALGVDIMAAKVGGGLWDFPGIFGTSFATPFVSGGAALLRRWMNKTVTTEPGHVYAMLLAAGENRNSAPYNGLIGAGNLALPTNGSIYWGKTTLAQGQVFTSVIPVVAGSVLDAAIWWPTGNGGLYQDIDLRLLNRSGTAVGSSLSSTSVFEKTSCTADQVGNFNISIQGYYVSGTQNVYWAVIKR